MKKEFFSVFVFIIFLFLSGNIFAAASSEHVPSEKSVTGFITSISSVPLNEPAAITEVCDAVRREVPCKYGNRPLLSSGNRHP